MSIAVSQTPTSPAPAYKFGELIYQYKDAYTVTAFADASGFLQLTVGATAVSNIDIGEVVFVSNLTELNDQPTGFVSVTAKGATTITTDAVYDASYTLGEVRLLDEQEFQIDTGNSTTVQPDRSTTLQVKPNKEGIYEIGCRQSVISRFGFGAPVEGELYTAVVSYRAYPTAISAPAKVVALKQAEGVAETPGIGYTNIAGVLSVYLSASYETLVEGLTVNSMVEGALENNRYTFYQGKSATFSYEVPGYASADVTVDIPFPAGLSFIIDGAVNRGVALDGDLISVGSGTYTITYDNGVDPVETYKLSVIVREALAIREACEDQQLVVWWSQGWKMFSFNLLSTLEQSTKARTVKNGNEMFAPSYEDTFQALTLTAGFESETILDYLNTLITSTEIFLATVVSGEITAYERAYVDGGNSRLKSFRPFRPSGNRFSVTLNKSTEIATVNEY